MRLQSDEKLVALIRDGHDRAFEVLFDRYQSRLLAFCRHFLGTLQDAEDVLQDVFVSAHAAMLADSRPINARPWLYRIARNRCLNFLRRPVADGQDSMDVHAHSNGATTLEHVQRREELRAIVADVHELPETQRTALVLRELDDLSYTEIAQAMGTTLPAVKSLLVRARMSLAESSEARILTCDDVRLELAEAAEGLAKASGPVRRHVRGCSGCRRYRGQLRSSSRALGALAPFALLPMLRGLIAKLSGGSAGTSSAGGVAGSAGGAAAGGSGVGAVGVGGAVSGIGGALGAKAAIGVATAALITAGAVGVRHFPGTGTDKSSAPSWTRGAVAQPDAHRLIARAVHSDAVAVASRPVDAGATTAKAATDARAPAATPDAAAASTEAPPATDAVPPAAPADPADPAATEPADAASSEPPADTSGGTTTTETGGGTDGDPVVGGSGDGTSTDGSDGGGEIVPLPPSSDPAPSPPTYEAPPPDGDSGVVPG